MLSCPSCKGRFCKTLENRVFQNLQTGDKALLCKKRCKRCKTVFLAKLALKFNKPQYSFATPTEWKQGQKIKQSPSCIKAGGGPLVGEYTLFISRNTAHIYEQVLRNHTASSITKT